MSLKWLVCVHLLLSAYQFLYPILSARGLRDRAARERADRWYIGIVLAINTHWIFFHSECLASVFEKQRLDRTYTAGRCPHVSFQTQTHRAQSLIPFLLIYVILRGELECRTKAVLVAWAILVNVWSRVAYPALWPYDTSPTGYCMRLAAAIRRRKAAMNVPV